MFENYLVDGLNLFVEWDYRRSVSS